MRYWILANPKFGYKNHQPHWAHTTAAYFEEIFIPFLRKQAKPEDRLILLGNLFANADLVSTASIHLAQQIFETISTIVPITMLVGKTDVPSGSKHNQINSLHLFRHYPHIEVISEATERDDILFLPWTTTPIRDLSQSRARLVFMTCDYWNNQPEMVRETMKLRTAFCGYYDNGAASDENICIVGAPYQLEKTTPEKGFVVWDDTRGQAKFVENKFSPRYQTLTITSPADIEALDAKQVAYNYTTVYIDPVGFDNKTQPEILLHPYGVKEIIYRAPGTPLPLETSSTDVLTICQEYIEKANNPLLASEFEKIITLPRNR